MSGSSRTRTRHPKPLVENEPGEATSDSHRPIIEQTPSLVALGPKDLLLPDEKQDHNFGISAGPWTLGTRIGQGAYGGVYAAEHALTGVEAVVKLIASDEPKAAERFRREAKALGTVSHPSIPLVYDAGFVRDEPLAYIALERLDGTDLDRLQASGWRPSEAEVIAILSEVVAPLVVAHDRGIIHRDLKPSNIFIESGGSPAERRVRVLDFGCAKLVGAGKLTSSGRPVGALAYQPPEAFGGNIALTAAVDVWTLGVTAYELLTGVHPFLDDTYSRTIERIRTCGYKPLSPDRFPIMASVVAACLHPDPGRRIADAEALAMLIVQQVESSMTKAMASKSEEEPHLGIIALWLGALRTTNTLGDSASTTAATLKRLIGFRALNHDLRRALGLADVSAEEFAIWATQRLAHVRTHDGFTMLRKLQHDVQMLKAQEHKRTRRQRIRTLARRVHYFSKPATSSRTLDE